MTATWRGVSGRERIHVRRVRIRGDRWLPVVVGRAPDVLDRPARGGDRADRTLETDLADASSGVERRGARLRDLGRFARFALAGVLLFLRRLIGSRGW